MGHLNREKQKMLDNILELKDEFDIFIFDIYGVLWDGKKVIPNSLETLAVLKAAGKKVMLLSNSTQVTSQMEEGNARRGFIKGLHYDEGVSSGALAHLVFSNDERELKYYQFAKPNPLLFEESCYEEVETPEEADFIYIGVPQIEQDGQWQDVLTIEPFQEELQRYKELGKTLVCANPDLKAHEKTFEEAVIRQGGIAAYYQQLKGDVACFGKPYANIFEHTLQEEATPKERILMIGDTLGTDILGGNNFGIKTALTQTGISFEDMQKEGVADIEAYAEKLGIIPTYYVKSI